ncbi:MAG: hypothetical protein ACR2PX_10800 [Endozoicomonas sp.]|uniref:hypothetical protein n=1 Tax=Endozoicomonas sp. TaxID=1892382 RepID=UPI003D9BCEC6
MRYIYLVPFLSVIPFSFSGPLPLQPLSLADAVGDISTLLELRSVSNNRKEGSSYHYICKATDFIYGLEWEQESNQTFCQHLDPDGNIVLTSSFAPAFSEQQEIEEVAEEFIMTNRMPNLWIVKNREKNREKNKDLCYLHRVNPVQEHCLKTREAKAELESGSGMMVIPDQTPSPTAPDASTTRRPKTTIDIPATTGGAAIIATGLLLIALFLVETKFHCMLNGCKSLYNKVQLNLP